MTHEPTAWLKGLSEEDGQFLKRFVLASGSLKELAENYGVTYPTIRLRLDRLIEKIKVLDSAKIENEYERLLRAKYAEGKVDAETLKELLSAFNESVKVKTVGKE